ncbi:MAG: alpha-E domain-containing protein [Desulfuromonadales bacterium]|nr:alpha-E domain-containing protein [Desulfuromonadales bacterium]
MTAAKISLYIITGSPRGTFANKAEQSLGRLLTKFQYASLEEIFEHGLHQYLDSTQTRINAVDSAIQDVFFSPKLSDATTAIRTME